MTPGNTERHQSQGHSALRNFQMAYYCAHDDALFFTDSSPDALTAGLLTLLTARAIPVPRTISFEYTADATVTTRGPITITVYGQDQFGRSITDTLTHAGVTASTSPTVHGLKVFARIDAINLDAAIVNAQAGDTFEIGLSIAESPGSIIWGLPQRVASAAAFLGLFLDEAGTYTIRPLTDITYVPGVDGVKFAAGSVPDAGDDRVLWLSGRTDI